MSSLFKVPQISYRALRVWQRNGDSYKRFYKSNLIGSLGEPLLFLFGMGYGIGGYLDSINNMSYMQFIAPGLIMATSMYAATFECTFGSYTRMAEQKTYSAILSTPLSLGDIVFGDILWGATKSLISGSIMLIVIVSTGLMQGSLFNIVFILFLIFLIGLLFASMAMIVTALSPSYDFFAYYLTLVLAPMFFLSGIFFPLTKFPYVVRLFSGFLPMTYAVDMSRTLVIGDYTSKFSAVLGLFYLVIATLVFIIIAINKIEKRLIK